MSDAAVIRKADVDILVAACAVFLPDDVSPEVTAAFDRLLTAWDEVGGWTDKVPPRASAEWLCESCKAIHPWHEGDRFTVPCPDCGTSMTPSSPLLRDLQAAVAENAELRAKAARYENGIAWGTSCLSCSAVLDSCIAETNRREQAEAELSEAREQIAHLSAALAGDNEGARLWMLDCGRLVSKHRDHATEVSLKLGEAREIVTNFLAEYGHSDIPMFKVGQDLANSVLKRLDNEGGEPS